jgi:hypothetical protein
MEKPISALTWSNLNDFGVNLDNETLLDPPDEPLDAFEEAQRFEGELHLSRKLYWEPCLDSVARSLTLSGLPFKHSTKATRVKLVDPVSERRAELDVLK